MDCKKANFYSLRSLFIQHSKLPVYFNKAEMFLYEHTVKHMRKIKTEKKLS